MTIVNRPKRDPRKALHAEAVRLNPPPEPTPQSDLMNAREAAAYLRMSEAWVRSHSAPLGPDPKVPVVRLGKRVVFKRSSLDRFIERYEERESVAS